MDNCKSLKFRNSPTVFVFLSLSILRLSMMRAFLFSISSLESPFSPMRHTRCDESVWGGCCVDWHSCSHFGGIGPFCRTFLSSFWLLVVDFWTIGLFSCLLSHDHNQGLSLQYRGAPDPTISRLILSMHSNVAKEFAVPIWTFHGRLKVARFDAASWKSFASGNRQKHIS